MYQYQSYRTLLLVVTLFACGQCFTANAQRLQLQVNIVGADNTFEQSLVQPLQLLQTIGIPAERIPDGVAARSYVLVKGGGSVRKVALALFTDIKSIQHTTSDIQISGAGFVRNIRLAPLPTSKLVLASPTDRPTATYTNSSTPTIIPILPTDTPVSPVSTITSVHTSTPQPTIENTPTSPVDTPTPQSATIYPITTVLASETQGPEITIAPTSSLVAITTNNSNDNTSLPVEIWAAIVGAVITGIAGLIAAFINRSSR